MSETIALVGCTKSKRDDPSTARDLYDESRLFRKRRRLAERDCDRWSVVSAEYGLVHPDEKLEPYDTHITDVETAPWADDVVDSLAYSDGDHVVLLCGSKKYVDPLRERLQARGLTVTAPIRSLMPGKQYNRLDELLETEGVGPAPEV